MIARQGELMMTVVAAVQAGSVLGDTEKTIAKLDHFAGICAEKRVDLAVFPEAFIGGYPKGMSFGATLGIRTDEGRGLFQQYADCAITVPGVITERIGNIAKKHSLYLVVGAIERAGGTLYCTALYVGPDGTLLGKHRKLMPTAVERLIWGFGDGSTLAVIDSPIGKFGALICWENYMPLARMAMYAQHIQIYCAPTVDDRDAWIPTLRHIAREGRCFVISSCQFLTREAYPPNWIANTEHLPGTPIRGGSCIVDPMGNIVAGPQFGEEGVLTADINLDDIIKGTFDFDVVGHYARPDVFRFQVINDQG
jgi:nitrilase